MPTMTQLSLATLTVTASSFGAELQSLCLDGHEYLWQGDSRWWTGRSPILFPIVGRLHDDHAPSERGEVRLQRHGLARRHEFDLAESDPTRVTYELRSDDETLAAFPYDFRLRVSYELRCDDLGRPVLEQGFEVSNTGDVTLPFVVGAHPAFNVPVRGEGSFDDHDLRFSSPWTYDSPALDIPTNILDWQHPWRVLTDTDRLPLTHRSFDVDTIVFHDVPDRRATLVNRETGHGVELAFPGFDYLGVWSAAGDAPFVAVEPWCGCSSGVDERGRFEDKRGMTLLEPGETFARVLTIRPF